jgi:hypothetical protein
MWIDQCCINQTDDVEKSAQVQLMGEIYRTAERTTIWLGESNENVQYAQELMQSLIDADSADGLAGASDVDVMRKMVGVEAPRDKASQLTSAITNFLNRDWFTRAWVFQEAVLSMDLKIRCGATECPFVLLKRVADAVCDIPYDGGIRTIVSFDDRWF